MVFASIDLTRQKGIEGGLKMGLAESNDRWDVLQNELRVILEKEVFLTRELLSNLHQEEISLMLQDTGTCHYLLQQRGSLVDRLGDLRSFRDKTNDQILEILGKNLPLQVEEEIIPCPEEMGCEIISLRDQLVALTERMNLQKLRNQHLTAHPEHLISLRHHEIGAQEALRAKRKPAVAVYQIKK
ncbi:MAG: hypothetical protein HYZ48_02665 [Chlamydiales bacterium]|nr:hypothetical protein [Chlamydiales bacterium]